MNKLRYWLSPVKIGTFIQRYLWEVNELRYYWFSGTDMRIVWESLDWRWKRYGRY